MKNTLRGSIIGGVIGIAIVSVVAFFGGRIVGNQNSTVTAMEVGMKCSDLEWLYRAGMVSDDEFKTFQNAYPNLSIDEMDKLLDELLEGKEEEYLARQAELKSKMQSILDN